MRSPRSKTPIRDLRTYSAARAVRWDVCDYTTEVDIHVTICADRGEPFRDESVARMVCESVEFYCRKLVYRLYGYTLMPDHLHVLLSPANSGIALGRWLREFKSFTTNAFMKQAGQRTLWQRSANDHVCRAGETAAKVLAYIVSNPVQAGLVQRWQDWPWTKAFIDV